MARKKKHPEHVNHERWLISYADFITLLFAFFVVMFAVSRVDSNQVGRFTESFSKAVGIDIFPQTGRGILPGEAPPTPSGKKGDGDSEVGEELKRVRSALVERAKKSDELKELKVMAMGNELVLRLPVSVLFDSGDDRVKQQAERSLKAIADEIRLRNVDVRVEGHTDNLPIQTARFRSNWDLSASRATAVIDTLATLGGLAPARLSAAGYGEFHPIAPNDTPEGRAKNRRVDLVIKISSVPKSSAVGTGEVGIQAPNVKDDPAIQRVREELEMIRGGAFVELDAAAPNDAHDAHEQGDATEHEKKGHEEGAHDKKEPSHDKKEPSHDEHAKEEPKKESHKADHAKEGHGGHP